MIDERHGLPSASSGERLYHCPGSLQLSAEAPPETPTAEAQQGDEIHKAMESDDFSGLDEVGRTIAERLKVLETAALDAWIGSKFDEGKITIEPEREVRLWIRDRQTRALAGSAQIDVGWIGKRSAFVIDFKSGYLPVTDAFRNIQARIQALAVWHEYPKLEHIRAGVASFRFRGKFDPVDYDVDALRKAENEFFWHAWQAKQPHAPRVPGPWCRYCPGKSICPENAALSMLPMVHTEGQLLKKADVGVLVRKLTLAQQAFIQERKTLITNFLDAVSDSMKLASKEDLASVGFELVPGGNLRTIPDVQKMWDALFAETAYKNPIEFSLREFQECCKAAVGVVEEKLVEKIMARDGGTKAEATAKAKKIMAPAVQMVPKSPTLKPLK